MGIIKRRGGNTQRTQLPKHETPKPPPSGAAGAAGDGEDCGYAMLSGPRTSTSSVRRNDGYSMPAKRQQHKQEDANLGRANVVSAAARKTTENLGGIRASSTFRAPLHQASDFDGFDLDNWLEETPPLQMLSCAACVVFFVAVSLTYAEKDFALKQKYQPFLCNYGGANIPGICPDWSSAKASTRYTPSGRRKKNTLPLSRTHAQDATAVPSTEAELYAKGEHAKGLVPDISNTDWNIVLTRLETFIIDFTWTKTEDGRYDLSDHQGVMKPVYDTVIVFDAWQAVGCPENAKPLVDKMLTNIEHGFGSFFDVFKSFIAKGHPVTNDQIIKMQEQMGKLQEQFRKDVKAVRKETFTPYNPAIKKVLDARAARAISDDSSLPLGVSLKHSTEYLKSEYYKNKVKKNRKKKNNSKAKSKSKKSKVT